MKLDLENLISLKNLDEIFSIREFVTHLLNFCRFKVGKKHLMESFKIDLKKILISHFEVPLYLKKSKKNIFKIYNIPKKNLFFIQLNFGNIKII